MANSTSVACAACHKAPSEGFNLLRCERCKKVSYCGQECQKGDWETHKKTCKRPNYLLKVHLRPDDIVDPPIHRTLSCPATATFDDLHRALQVAFGWSNTHTYDFKVKDPIAEEAWEAKQNSMSQVDSMLELIKGLQEGDGSQNKQYLLRIVEAEKLPFGFKVDAMHDRQRFNPNTPQMIGSKVRLFHVFDKSKYQDKQMEYEYDFGDCWEHDIALVGRGDSTDGFKCIDGEGHGCAEDVGSEQGWAALKTAFRAPRPNKAQKKKIQWYKHTASNADPQGLGNGRERIWSKEGINVKLASLRIV